MRTILALALLSLPAISHAAECQPQLLSDGSFALSATFPDSSATDLCFARLTAPAVPDTCTKRRVDKAPPKGCGGISIAGGPDYGSVVVAPPVGRWEYVAYAKGPWNPAKTDNSVDRFVVTVLGKPPTPPELLGIIEGLEKILQSLKALSAQ